MNWPNFVTTLRIALIPIFVVVYLVPSQWTYPTTAVLFGIAALTDWLDGYLARRLEQVTRFGAFLDPVADKLIVVAALVLLISSHSNFWLTVPALIIIGREIMISALREWMAEVNRRRVVGVNWMGKVKTTLQVSAIILLLAAPPILDAPIVVAGYVLIYAAALMTLWSMVLYLRAAWPSLSSDLDGQQPP